jgi:hypothetical protein
MGELLKHLIVFVTLATLLPLTSYAGATMLHPRQKLKDLMYRQSRVGQETYDTQDPAARASRATSRKRVTRRTSRRRKRLFYRAMFWVGFPIGLGALVAGLLLRPPTVATALGLGGLCTLSAGCYSYWDDMGDALRFFSLLIVLAVVGAIGLGKFARPPLADRLTPCPYRRGRTAGASRGASRRPR